VGQVNNLMRALPPLAASETPTLGAIKRALHALMPGAATSTQRDAGAALREAHDLLRQFAHRNGIDPDIAVQRSRAAVEAQRERMAVAGSAASDPAQT
jgi:hypothetical protein